jgi:lauroyl/myristoyl acyltransferase
MGQNHETEGRGPVIENVWLWIKYFFFFPVFALFPAPYPYLFSRYLSRLDYRFNSAKKASMERWMTRLLDRTPLSKEELDQAIRRYFEVIYCDEIDNYIYLLGFSRRFIRRLKIDGEENLTGVLNHGGAAILICYHFGGGFWVLPFVKGRGVKIQFFSTDIKKEDYPSKRAFYFFHKLSNWIIGRMFERQVAFKKEGRRSLIKALQEGFWVSTAFDVPPYLTKENVEVEFLDRKTRFPKGLVSIARELNVPILPFFSFLEEGRYRRVCFEKPIYVKDEEDSVRECVRLIEGRIRERPDHWHMWPFADQFFDPEERG